MYRIIGSVCGWGAQIRECELGPEILKSAGVLEKLKKQNIPISDWDMLYPSKRMNEVDIPLSESLPLIYEFNLQLASVVEKTLSSNEFPIILGGGHTIAVGTWNGAYQFFKKKKQLPMGLIWVDAHMDAHIPETTPSLAWHGMPVAGLLGYGDPKMAKLIEDDPVLRPENLCYIGVRSYEEDEIALLEKLNIRVFFADEVKKRGVETVMKEEMAHVTKHTKVFGVSLDLDVIDPKEAPGVGSPEKGGLASKELLHALLLLKNDQRFKIFELVEYNPKRNHHEKTAKLCLEILSTVMKKEKPHE